MTIGEAGITFYSAGGHNHDGINSSRINSTRYSVWDWEWDIITSAEPSRLLRQILNYQNFTRSIIDIINNSILSPAGIQLLPGSLVGSAISANTITADQIQTGTITADLIEAGTITGDLFNANVVLVDQIVKSNNYVTGVSGWAIAGDGTAEFDSASIRGAITASAIIVSDDNFWNANGFKLGGNTGIYSDDGIVYIGTSVEIEGVIEADELGINDDNFWNAEGFKLGGGTGIFTSNGKVVIGTDVDVEANVTANSFRIDDDNIWNAEGFVLGGNTGIYTDDGIVFIGTSVKIEGTIIAQQLAINNNNIWNAEGFVLGGNTGIFTYDGKVIIGRDVDVQANVTANAFSIDDDNFWNVNGFSINGLYGIAKTDLPGIPGVIRLGSDIYINPDDGSIFNSSGSFQLRPGGGIIGGWEIFGDFLLSSEGSPGDIQIGKFTETTAGLLVKDQGRIAMLELVGDGQVSDVRLYVGSVDGNQHFTSEYDTEGSMHTETTGRITSTSAFFGPLFSTGDHVNPSPEDGTYFNDNGIYTAGTISAGTIYADESIRSGDEIIADGGIQSGNNVDVVNRVTAYGEGVAFYAINGGIVTEGSSSMGGLGIRYPGPGVASANFVAFQWDSPNLFGIVDNAVSMIVGTASDIRFKKNIVDAEDIYAQKLLNNLRIVEFNPYDPETDRTNMDLKNIGVVAQEAIEAFPDIVKDFNKDGSNQYSLAVDYIGFVPYLIKTVQYLSNKINDLTTRLEALEQ